MMITKASIEKVLPLLLRPIVRLCVRYGVKVHQVEQEVKTLFVQEARHFLNVTGETESVSKISIMTGLQRPVVSTLSTTDRQVFQESLVSKVIGAWCTKKKYITARGAPRILTVDGKLSEFAELVNSVSQALNPYTVLFELERAKLVQRTPRGIELLTQSFNSRHDVEQSIQYLASDISDLAQAVEENVNAENASVNHHITTEYDNIPLDKAPLIRKMLLREGDKFHKRMRRMLSKYDRDFQSVKGTEESVRVAVGSFSVCQKKG